MLLTTSWDNNGELSRESFIIEVKGGRQWGDLCAIGPQLDSASFSVAQSRTRRRDLAGPQIRARIDEVMEQFPMLRQRQHHKAVALSGGQQKQREIARSLILDPKLILIDEPSIGLSPRLVHEVFLTLQKLRDNGLTVLMVEQNAKAALAISDYGLVLELGQTKMYDRANTLLADPRVGRLFLGGSIEEAAV
jgi:ABC-type branched-subunit amino acid transport system ATPase component